MAQHNENKLSLIYDKRMKDFVAKYPRPADGALVMHHLISDELSWVLPNKENGKEYPYNWELKNFRNELEKRGYDLSTLRFSIELKK